MFTMVESGRFSFADGRRIAGHPPSFVFNPDYLANRRSLLSGVTGLLYIGGEHHSERR